MAFLSHHSDGRAIQYATVFTASTTDMTRVEAAFLQMTWNHLVFHCVHTLKIDLERSEDGHLALTSSHSLREDRA
jgi:hypothetical protein